MVQVALALLFAVTGASSEKTLSYEDAFALANKEKKPLLVLVSAPWCVSCHVMKRDTIEPMKETGELKNVVVTVIDKDQRPELAEQLMRGETLPQIVVFSQSSGSWKRYSLTGMQSKSRIAELMERAAAK